MLFIAQADAGGRTNHGITMIMAFYIQQAFEVVASYFVLLLTSFDVRQI